MKKNGEKVELKKTSAPLEEGDKLWLLLDSFCFELKRDRNEEKRKAEEHQEKMPTKKRKMDEMELEDKKDEEKENKIEQTSKELHFQRFKISKILEIVEMKRFKCQNFRYRFIFLIEND